LMNLCWNHTYCPNSIGEQLHQRTTRKSLNLFI
jgi:hypothetical protein